MPGGGAVAYSDPVVLCPYCDEDQFGMSYNEDFFKEHGLHGHTKVD